MIRNIKNAFLEMLNQSTWMDAESKSKAAEKVSKEEEKMRFKIRS
jgi:predicted metalloendopeptidase